MSFTRVRELEGSGASRVGSLFIYILVLTIGLKMDINSIFNDPGLFLIGFIWLGFHVIILLITAKLIKAPFFFVAVGSQANVGGAASAPGCLKVTPSHDVNDYTEPFSPQENPLPWK